MKRFLSTQNILIGILIILSVLFLIVMFCDNPKWAFGLFGTRDKFEVLKFLGIGMGGILLALQALASHRRARAMEVAATAQGNAANAQAEATKEQAKANLHTEQGQRQERLKNAIQHLGHTSASVRLGGAYELFHLAKDIPQLRQTVFEILCAHIRRTTSEDDYRNSHKAKPSEEIQSLLTLLFVQNHTVFKGLRIDLHGSWLNGANLWGARLVGVNLNEAHLSAAFLRGARLLGALLGGAHLQLADLNDVRLQGGILHQANLQAADMKRAWLQGASMGGAGLQSAKLSGAQFAGANVWTDHLTAEEQQRLRRPVHDRQWPVWASLPTFAERIRKWIGKEGDLFATDARFSGAKFARGLSLDYVNFLIKGLSDGDAKELREKLESHTGGRASRTLAEDSGAIAGTYTEDEAEQWIVEYEEAMSEVPGEDS